MMLVAFAAAIAISPSRFAAVSEPAAGAVKKNKRGIEMVYVPSGPFTMGSDNSREEGPMRKVTLAGFWIGKNDVTVAEFRKFTDDTKYKYKWDRSQPAWGWLDNTPMVNVSWEAARAFCKWADGDLPTEAQWEKAARGTDGREYPWGNEFDAANAWWSKNGKRQSAGSPAPVGSIPKGASPYGCLDMSGNVWQWCLDWFSRDGYEAGETTDPKGPLGGQMRVLRGGSWVVNTNVFLRCTARIGQSPLEEFHGVGFRVCSP